MSGLNLLDKKRFISITWGFTTNIQVINYTQPKSTFVCIIVAFQFFLRSKLNYNFINKN